jgi:molybdate transport system substrate-binding protein
MNRAWLVMLALLVLPATAACGDDDDSRPTLRIAAAADLRSAMESAEDAIGTACDVAPVYVFGSSGQLKEQVLAGAPFGLFLSADAAYPDEVQDAGLSVEGGVRSYAVGRLALAWAPGVEPLSGIEDLAREDIEHISIANPEHAPYGRAARQAAERAGAWEAIEDRLVLGENVRQATDYVVQGNAEAGLIALSLVIGTDATYIPVPEELHDPITQAGVVVAGRGVETEAMCVLDYLGSEDGQALLRDFGFEPVE